MRSAGRSAVGGVAGYWSEPAAMGCLSVTALLAGYVGWKYFTRRDEEDGWDDELAALGEPVEPTYED